MTFDIGDQAQIMTVARPVTPDQAQSRLLPLLPAQDRERLVLKLTDCSSGSRSSSSNSSSTSVDFFSLDDVCRR